MAVKIRLRRVGKRNAACHRIVVADGRSPRDGRFIENIGTYDPRGKKESIDLERAEYWLSQGAQPSETVAAIIKRARAGQPMTPAPKPEQAPESPETALEAEEAPAEEPAAEEAGAEEAAEAAPESDEEA